MPIDAASVKWDAPDPASVQWDDAPAPSASFPEQLGKQVLNAGAGAVRGAGSIGATLLAPVDAAARALGVQNDFIGRTDRREAMTNALRDLGADPESIAFQTGKVGAEVAGTLGVGGGLANALRAVPVAAPIIPAIESAGMVGPNMLARMAGGAITGGASAGLVDPSTAGTGALIGGAAPPAIKVAGYVGEKIGQGATGLLKHVLGMTTGVGPEPISQAFKAGRTANSDFTQNVAGNVPLTDVLDRAKQGLSAMTAAKSAEYRSGMIPIGNDKTVLNFTGIDSAVQNAGSVTSYKGQVKNDAAASAVEKMSAIIDDWKKLNPADFHTPEGMDALKQKLGGVLESIPYQEKTARLAAGKVYNATKAEIEKQAPTYASVMKDYASASEQISEIERALSLGDKASKDTAMRKLQSLMRNNVQTNYGNRLTLAQTLENQGGVELMPALAGQALNSWTPRSLSGQIGSGAAVLGSVFTGNPVGLAALPLQSPRLVGNLAYGAGRLTDAGQNALAQLGSGATGQLVGPNALSQALYRAAPVGLAVGR
jgi:hypothetical protein